MFLAALIVVALTGLSSGHGTLPPFIDNGTIGGSATYHGAAYYEDPGGANPSLLVVDSFGSKLQRFFLRTRYLATFPGLSLSSPWGVAVDLRRQTAIVTDTENHCIKAVQLFPPVHARVIAGSCGNDGLSGGFGTNGLWNEPKGLAYNQALHQIYVADYNNCLIRQVDWDMKYNTTSIIAGRYDESTVPCGELPTEGKVSEVSIGKPLAVAFSNNTNMFYFLDEVTQRSPFVKRVANGYVSILSQQGSTLCCVLGLANSDLYMLFMQDSYVVYRPVATTVDAVPSVNQFILPEAVALVPDGVPTFGGRLYMVSSGTKLHYGAFGLPLLAGSSPVTSTRTLPVAWQRTRSTSLPRSRTESLTRDSSKSESPSGSPTATGRTVSRTMSGSKSAPRSSSKSRSMAQTATDSSSSKSRSVAAAFDGNATAAPTSVPPLAPNASIGGGTTTPTAYSTGAPATTTTGAPPPSFGSTTAAAAPQGPLATQPQTSGPPPSAGGGPCASRSVSSLSPSLSLASMSRTALVAAATTLPAITVVVARVTQAASGGTVAASTMVPTVATQAGRTAGLLSLLSCQDATDPGYDDPLDRASWSDHPLRFTIPSAASTRRLQLQTAVVLGNVFLILAAGIGATAVLAAIRYGTLRSRAPHASPSTQRSHALAWARFPSVFIVPLGVLVQPTMTAATAAILAPERSATSIAVGSFGALAVASTLVAGVLLTSRAYARYGVFGSVAVHESEAPRSSASCGKFVERREEWAAASVEDGRLVLGYFCFILEPYTSKAPWFALADLVTSVIGGIAAGLPAASACIAGQWLQLASLAVYLLLIGVYRPHATWLDFCLQITLAVMQASAAGLSLAAAGSASAETAATYLVMASSFTSVVLSFCSVALLLRRQISVRLRKRAARPTVNRPLVGNACLGESWLLPEPPAVAPQPPVTYDFSWLTSETDRVDTAGDVGAQEAPARPTAVLGSLLSGPRTDEESLLIAAARVAADAPDRHALAEREAAMVDVEQLLQHITASIAPTNRSRVESAVPGAGSAPQSLDDLLHDGGGPLRRNTDHRAFLL